MKLRSLICLALAVGGLAGCNKPHGAAAPAAPRTAAQAPSADEQASLKQLEAMHFEAVRTHAGEPLPADVLVGADGRATSLAALKGRPVLVNLWARWCAPCRAEMPTLASLAAARADRLQVVAVNEDVTSTSHRPLGDLAIGASIVSLTDRSGAVARKLRGDGFPTTILFGADGRERWRLTGVLNWTKDQASRLLAEADRTSAP